MSAKEPNNPNAHGAWGAAITAISSQEKTQSNALKIENKDSFLLSSVTSSMNHITNFFSSTVEPIKDGEPSKKFEGKSTQYGTFSW